MPFIYDGEYAALAILNSGAMKLTMEQVLRAIGEWPKFREYQGS